MLVSRQKVLELKPVNNLLGVLHSLLVQLWCRIIHSLLDLNMLALDLLDLVLLTGIMFPILIELRKARPYIVHKQLGQLFIGLHHEAEKLPMIVVHNLA